MSLAELLRPESLDEIAGQRHLFASGTALRSLLENGAFDSLIFVGPPGTGKTTAARVAGKTLSMPFHPLHSTTAGAADLKNISEMAVSYGRPMLLFIDEIHRYNKTQQNLLLKLIDDRHIKIIGASTENPTYSLNPAFRSRSMIFRFRALEEGDLRELAKRAVPHFKQKFDVDAVDYEPALPDIIAEAAGDARRFLNVLELAAMLGKRKQGTLTLSVDGLDDIVKKRNFDDDEYYDLLSAMIKSIRGTDPDAALLWALKLVKSGVPPEAVFRRLMISASEDIGNAFPDALVFVNSAYSAFMNVGLPEGMIILAQAVNYLASCPKSNKSYMSLHIAQEYLEAHDPKVPVNIAHNAQGYKYPFDFGGFVAQKYKPDGVKFYEPSDNGFEQKIKERLERLWGK
jgi:putative ATPase